jgi:two-component system CheB/CheR fusion protein
MTKQAVGHTQEVSSFPVIGIGASAGGLEAIKLFLEALPVETGMAFVFVQHLNPKHESGLAVLLQKYTKLPVVEISHQLPVRPDHFYVLQQGVTLKVTEYVFLIEGINKKVKNYNPIDQFFISLGAAFQSYAAGVILSGMLKDGSLGLQTIKSYGGITFAQDEESAAYEGMPGNAARLGVVDFILPPAEIAKKLIAVNKPFRTSDMPQQEDEDVFKQVLTVLRVRRGVDFQHYKISTLKRRIIRRMALNKIDLPSDYLYLLRENKSEQDALYNDMLISVTQFFRDSAVFEVLSDTIFPELIRQKIEKNEPLRIWVTGCASGEEAYTMAICLLECLGEQAGLIKVQIFATDISETALSKARSGLYRHNEVNGLSPARIDQFFTKLDGHYQVSKQLRDMCIFAFHNVLKDPPFSKLDLVSCRNVLIYFEPVLQKRALTTFNYALNNNSFLLLGKSESPGSQADRFVNYKPLEKIFQRKGPPGRFMTVASQTKEESFRSLDQVSSQPSGKKDIFKIADELMLSGFMVPGVLVDDKFEIIQFRGNTENWLTPPPGKPSFNVLKMARESLSFELRSLLHQARNTGLPARKFGVFFQLNDLQHFVNLHVVPASNDDELFYLVIFQPASSIGIQPNMFDTGKFSTNEIFDEAKLRIEHLERELIQSRADMRVVSEEQEAANMELQSANEELLSGSEEMQSLNEELETSKEELQSTNEEILVMNTELIERNDQLINAQRYSEGIVETIRDPLLILDSHLRVLRASEGFYRKFQVTEKETVGNYLFDLGNGQWNIPALRRLLEGMLPQKKEIADFEVTHDFPRLGEKTMLINARRLNRTAELEMILIAIEDITVHLAYEALRREMEQLRRN